MRNLSVITDIGVDDAIALVLLDKLLPQAKKTLVTSYGNCRADVVEKNGLEFAAAQPLWALAIGAKHPKTSDMLTFTAEDFHGEDGLWNIRPPRSSRAVGLTNVQGDRFISLGPLTYLDHYSSNTNLAEVTIMAGCFGSAKPEPNIRMDIPAAKNFFKRCSGTKVRVIPADVSGQVRWTKENILAIPENSATNVWLKQLMLAWFANCPYDSFALHDPATVYLSVLPDRVAWKNSGINVLESGVTLLDSSLPDCKIAVPAKDPDLLAKDIFRALFHD